ncbi:MAG: Spx/MgsR family RNA polymerase-binding regulatory protein [Hyphomicrobiales bacterium]|nr:Spx/MgsR family RNA polymerase-binding regulatory protein [Hyphomicrobiales bacterium]
MYGLKNCDICRKALKWAAERGVQIDFIDVRDGGMSRADIERFVASTGWQTALNRKSTTWRGLDDAEKADIDDARAVDLIAQHPALLKRPVFDIEGRIVIGFDAAAQDQLTSNNA